MMFLILLTIKFHQSVISWGDRYETFVGKDTSDSLFLPFTLWLDSNDYKIGGNLFSTEYNYIEITVCIYSNYL